MLGLLGALLIEMMHALIRFMVLLHSSRLGTPLILELTCINTLFWKAYQL